MNYNRHPRNVIKSVDPYTMLLCHFDGVDESQIILDTTGRHTLTAQNQAQLDTAYKKFGDSSLLLDGVNDYITTPSNSDFTFGDDPFTLEAWVYLTDPFVTGPIVSRVQEYGSAMNMSLKEGQVYFLFASGGYYYAHVQADHNMSTDVWNHLAYIRGWDGVANRFAATVNGTLVGYADSAFTCPDYGAPLQIGADVGNTDTYLGVKMDELRISKGIARWTSNFTPPVAQYSKFI
jgi:hypothetical protein